MAQAQHSTPIEDVTGSLGSVCSEHNVIANLCASCFHGRAEKAGGKVLTVQTSTLGKRWPQEQIILFTSITPGTAVGEEAGSVLFLTKVSGSGADVIPLKRLRVFEYLHTRHEGRFKPLGGIGKNNIGLFALGDDQVLKFVGNRQSAFEREEIVRKTICATYAEKMKSIQMDVICALGEEQVRLGEDITCIGYPRAKGATVQEAIDSCRSVEDRVRLSMICGALTAKFHLIPSADETKLLVHGDFNASNILYSPLTNGASLAQCGVEGCAWSFVDNDSLKILAVPKRSDKSANLQMAHSLRFDASSLAGNLYGPMVSEGVEPQYLGESDKALIKQAFTESYMSTWKANTKIPFEMDLS